MYPVGKGTQPPIVIRSFQGSDASPTFLGVTLVELQAMSQDKLDELPFGVVGLAPDGTTELYNKAETALSGLTRESVLGRPFFLSIGVCMNNFLVAHRVENEAELDAVLDYVLTFRMRPTPVRLRLLKGPAARNHFVLLQR